MRSICSVVTIRFMNGRELIDTPLASEVELRAERASALRRVASRLEKLLEELQRWYYVVQRETMGLTHPGDLELLFPVPSKRPPTPLSL
jgi:hypothetical protein